jgi:hypothetical protein
MAHRANDVGFQAEIDDADPWTTLAERECAPAVRIKAAA